MLPIQIVLTLFFLIAASRVVTRYRVGEISVRGMVVWLLFWLAAIAVAVRPNLTSSVAKMLGVGRGADFVVYASLAALFFIVFRLMVKIEKLNRDITKVIRNETLKK